MPDEYYPTTLGSVALGFLATLPLWIFLGLFSWGMIEWGLAHPVSLGWTNFFVFMVYLIILIIIIYFGSA